MLCSVQQNKGVTLLLFFLVAGGMVSAGLCPNPTEIAVIPDLDAGDQASLLVETHNQGENRTVNLDMSLTDSNNRVYAEKTFALTGYNTVGKFFLETSDSWMDDTYTLRVDESVVEARLTSGTEDDTVTLVDVCSQSFSRSFRIRSPRKNYGGLETDILLNTSLQVDRVNKTYSGCGENGFCYTAESSMLAPAGQSIRFNLSAGDWSYSERNWSAVSVSPKVSWSMHLDKLQDLKLCIQNNEDLREDYGELTASCGNFSETSQEYRDYCGEVRGTNEHLEGRVDALTSERDSCRNKLDAHENEGLTGKRFKFFMQDLVILSVLWLVAGYYLTRRDITEVE